MMGYKQFTQPKRASFSESVDRMHLQGLKQLVDNMSASSCQQTCRKLNAKTCYPQDCCKLLRHVVKSLQMISWKKLYFSRLDAT